MSLSDPPVRPRPARPPHGMDAHALRVLEFDAMRSRAEAGCESPLGADLARALGPSPDPAEVARRVATGSAVAARLGDGAAPSLAGVADVADALRRAEGGGALGGGQLVAIARSLAAIASQREFLGEPTAEEGDLAAIALALLPQPRIESRLTAALDGDGTLRDEASPELAALRVRKRAAQARVVERIQAHTGGAERDALSDPIYTVRGGRYVLPVKSEARGRIRGIVHDVSASGSTVYIEPQDVVDAANDLRGIEAAEREEEARILRELSSLVGSVGPVTRGGLVSLGRLDLLYAIVRLGFEYGGVFPVLAGAPEIAIRRGRHPLLDPGRVVPVDLHVAPGRSVIVTGPNTGGKTVAMKMAGLFVAMAQAGMMLPADAVTLGPFPALFADIGDEQSLEGSLSTFSGHIRNVARALDRCVPGALVILDEAGAGTDPAEGAALARALLEEFDARGAAILASTHYGELKAFAFGRPGFRNGGMEFDTTTLLPTYRLVIGTAGASQALRVAERHGIPAPVVERAREAMGENARDVAEMLAGLADAQRLARQAQSRADRLAAESAEKERDAERRLREAEDRIRRTEDRARNAVDNALREIRIEAGDLLEKLRKAGSETELRGEARDTLERLTARGAGATRRLRRAPEEPPSSDSPIAAGMTVEIAGMGGRGTVIETDRDGSALVQIGGVKMTIPRRRLRPASAPVSAAPGVTTAERNRLRASAPTAIELSLLGKREEVARRDLERFVDDALLSGVPFVRIVHGKGEGILRKMVRDFLRAHPEVSSFEDAVAEGGGAGATVARFA